MFEKIFNCPIISIFFINILITLENFRKTKIFRSDDLFFIHSYSFVFLKFSQIFFIFCFFFPCCAGGMKSSFPRLFPSHSPLPESSVVSAAGRFVGALCSTAFFCSCFPSSVILSTFFPGRGASPFGSNAFRKSPKSRFSAQLDGKKILDNPGQGKSGKERFWAAVCRLFCFLSHVA